MLQQHWYYVVVASIGLVIGGLIVSYWPQQVTFLYQGSTCIRQLHVAPGHIGSDSPLFKAISDEAQSIGSTPIIAKAVCFTAQSAPQPGDYTVAIALPGVPFLKKSITVHVPSHPVASAIQLKHPIPATKSLIIALNTTDVIFSYRFKVADRSVLCESQKLGISCPLHKLNLDQGKDYDIEVGRYFGNTPVSMVLKTRITTLRATQMVSSTIKEGEIVYSKPASLSVQFDKPIKEFEAVLLQGDKEKAVKLKQTIKGNEAIVAWSDELTRRESYKLVFKRLQATDDSTLTEDTSIGFKLSGGPTVKGINVGTYKVALGAIAKITFDQALSEGQEITKLISASGGAKVIGYSGQTATVSFEGVPRCTDVVIKISDDLESVYKVKGGSAWQYTTRTICQSIITIGKSVEGRSITAYIFGSGAKRVVYTGAIHGDEVSTRSLMLRWVDTLEANIRSVPSDKTVVVIPVINPDGYAAGMRTNAHNVDLNRNFATSDWQQDITTVTNQPFPGGGGSSALSEPESSAIASYIAAIRPVLVLSYHSIGGLVAANQSGISAQLAKRYASLSGYSNATGSSSSFDYSISGTADDYYGQVLGVPSVLVELGSHTDPQFIKNQSAMRAMLRDT